MPHLRPRGATVRRALAVALMLVLAPGGGDAGAAGLATTSPGRDAVRQSANDPRPGADSSPGTFQASGPVDISLAILNLDPLPISVAAGEGVAVGAQVPAGAACSGSIAYPGRQWQPLDDVATRTGDCAWDVPVPLGSRPGSLAVTIDVSRNGQGRRLYGVVYVDVTNVGRTERTGAHPVA